MRLRADLLAQRVSDKGQVLESPMESELVSRWESTLVLS